jgi:transcriptional regulator with XRE-family HTH domain
MSPFSHLLHDLRMRHNIRQSELAELLGYEQSYISALEVGLKGPPTPEFVERMMKTLSLSPQEIDDLKKAVEASQRKLTIDANMPRDIYWLLHDLRTNISRLGPVQVRMIKDVLQLTDRGAEIWTEPVRRLRRQPREEAAM